MRLFAKQIALMSLIASIGFALFLGHTNIVSGLEWVRYQGLAGIFLYGLIYILATITVAPGLALAMGAGFIYGPFTGMLIVVPASIIGGMIAFFLGRSCFRTYALARLAKWPFYPKFNKAISEKGFAFILVLFAYPLTPFRILSYVVSLTNLSAMKFLIILVVSMTIHMLPYVYCGSLASDLTQASNTSALSVAGSNPWLTCAIFLSAGCAFMLLSFYYRRLIKTV